MQRTYTISKTLHISQLFSLLQEPSISEIDCVINFRGFVFFSPIDIVLLSELLISLIKAGCRSIVIDADFGNHHKYLSDIGLIQFCNSNYEQPNTISFINSRTAMPIRRISKESMPQYIALAHQFLNHVCPDKDLSILNIGLSELINNVYDHSQSTIGAYVFCQYYPRKNTIKFAVSDMGIGIPVSVNTYLAARGEAIKNDKECIQWALEEKKTVKSTPQNAGLGLHNVMSFVEANKGTLRLFSDKIGLYRLPGNWYFSENPVKPFAGTVVEIEIVIDNLQEIDTEEINFEI